MLNAFIYDGTRTPIGRHGGSLSKVRPDDLFAHVIKTVVERSPFAKDAFEDVIAGCVNQAGEDNRNVARFGALLAGLSPETGGQTVNRLCGSGMSAIIDAARAVTLEEADLYIAGGVESMSRAPFVMGKPEVGFARNTGFYDTTIGLRFPNSKYTKAFGTHAMPETADNMAVEFNIEREASDKFAIGSQQKYEKARQAGFYEGEISGVEVPQGRKKPPVLVDKDEHPRADVTLEKISTMRALNEGGVVTAANASGINDGAGALIIGSIAAGEKAGATPRGRIISSAIAGVSPHIMGIGPAYAIPKALARANLSLADMDVIEINEAFATQVLGCLKMLNIDADDARVNPNGGAIAIGHPLGASGARIVLTGLRQLEQTGGKYALLSMCIGVGQGIAMVIERCEL